MDVDVGKDAEERPGPPRLLNRSVGADDERERMAADGNRDLEAVRRRGRVRVGDRAEPLLPVRLMMASFNAWRTSAGRWSGRVSDAVRTV